MANGTVFACGWFVACGSGLCRGSEEGDICWFVGMVGMIGFDAGYGVFAVGLRKIRSHVLFSCSYVTI